jgi:predicted Zn-dependent peptidase
LRLAPRDTLNQPLADRMLLLALALAAADTTPQPPRAPAGLVTVHRQPALPIVALRLSLLSDDPPGYAGAGHLFQHLLLPSLREQVEQVGGEVQAARTSDAVVYTVVGPAAEVGYLAGVLRSALEPAAFGETAVLSAARELEEERGAEWETAGRHVRAALRARLFPGDLSPAGTPSSATRLTRDALSALWAEMYRPERVAVVAVGDVELPAVREAFSRLPAPPEGGLAETFPDTVPADPPLAPEATRAWLGLGYPAFEGSPAALTVAARLLRDLVRERLPSGTVEAEHWWTQHGQALVVLAAVPGAQLPAARRALRASVATLQDAVDATRVRQAAAAVRRDLLFYSRTPERMAEVIGGFVDREGDPDAAQRFYAALDQVGEEEVRALLSTLAERTPASVEVPPQKLPRT